MISKACHTLFIRIDGYGKILPYLKGAAAQRNEGRRLIELIIMVTVKKQRGESDEKLIARFRKKVLGSGLLLEYRERERFKSASEKRKERKYRIKHLIALEKQRV